MTDTDFELLRAQMRATARFEAPPVEEMDGWVHQLDAAGGPDKWVKASLYFDLQAELLRRHGIPRSR